MMPIDVQQSANSVRMWLEMRIVLPIRRSSFSRAFTSIRARGSSPLAGSSRISTGGSWTSVLARQSRCFMPRERLLTNASRLPVKSSRSSTSPTTCFRRSRGI